MVLGGFETQCISRSNIFRLGLKRSPIGPRMENIKVEEIKKSKADSLTVNELQKSDIFSSAVEKLSTETEKSRQTQFLRAQKSKKSLHFQRKTEPYQATDLIHATDIIVEGKLAQNFKRVVGV